MSLFRELNRLAVRAGKIMSVVQRGSLVILLTGSAVILFSQVLFRYVFHAPLRGMEEGLVFLIIWAYFIGGTNASAERSQITVGIVDEVIKKKRPSLIIKIVASIITLLMAIWLFAWGCDYLSWTIERKEVSASLSWPLIFAYSAIPVGLFLILIYTLVEFVDNVAKFFSRAKGVTHTWH